MSRSWRPPISGRKANWFGVDMRAKITADEIYSRLEDLEAAARALHHEDYAIMRDFWIGGHNALRHIHKHQRETDQHWRERRKRLVGANYTRPIIDKIARVEYGGHVVRRLGDPELQQRLEAYRRAETERVAEKDRRVQEELG